MLLLSLESPAQNGRDTLGNTVPIERQRALGLDKLTSEQRAGVHELLMDFYQVGVEDGREGKESSSAADSPESADLLSANALYREYRNNPVDANNRYFGNAVVLEGIRGQLLLTGENRAAIHIADGNVSNALILGFENRNQVAGLNQGQRFRFRCTGSDYYEPSLFMKNCVVVR